MSESREHRFVRQALHTLWGMATLTLLFMVALLIYTMSEQGRNPLPQPTPQTAGQASEQAAAVEISEKRQVALYFADASGNRIEPEAREFELGPYTQDNCRLAMEALIGGPRGARTPIIPTTVKIRSVYLEEHGELVVDFSAELRYDPTRPKSAAAEALMAYGIVNTLMQPALCGTQGEVKQVRFLFQGLPLDDSFPEHLDLSGPLTPVPQWSSASQ